MRGGITLNWRIVKAGKKREAFPVNNSRDLLVKPRKMVGKFVAVKLVGDLMSSG